MTPLRSEFDAFAVSGDEARLLDRWCDELETAAGGNDSLDFVEWIRRVPVPLQTLALQYLVEIDLTATIERDGSVRELADYQRELPQFASALTEIWPNLSAPHSGNEREETIRWPDRLRVIRKLGEGGMGQVFLAEHKLLGRMVAVKVLRGRLAQVELAVDRFRQEIRTLASLQHAGLAAALDADLIDGHLVLTMEYVPGRTLQEIVRTNGPLTWDVACTYCRELARTLGYLHEHGVVHRDVKPNNAMLDDHGRIRLLDVGMARLIADELPHRPDEQTPAFSGTPDFAAPEQQQPSQPDPRSDIYGLGSTLYYLICGDVMYPSASAAEKLRLHREGDIPSLRSPDSDIPARLEELFQQLVAKNPNLRPSSMSEVERTLSQLLDQRMTDSPLRSSRRHWMWAAGLATVSTVCVAAAVSSWTKSTHSKTAKNSLGMELSSLVPPVIKRDGINTTTLWSLSPVFQTTYSRVMGRTRAEISDVPMTGIDWQDAHDFCRQLSELTEERRHGRRYRLPLEAEWEGVAAAIRAFDHKDGRQMISDGPLQQWSASLARWGVWSWCADALLIRVGPRSLGNVPVESRIEQYPLRGGTGLFVHNFDLFMSPGEYRSRMDNLEIAEESDGRTRYYAPTRTGQEGVVIYHYEFEDEIQSAQIFASVLAHEAASTARLDISRDGQDWKLIDKGYVADAQSNPRDITAILQGRTEAFVRLTLRQDSPDHYLAQALRTSPDPAMQFPNVYQFLAETEPATSTSSARLVAPGTLRHSRIGLWVVCDIG